VVLSRKLLTIDAGGLQRGHTKDVNGFGPDRCCQGNGTRCTYVGTRAYAPSLEYDITIHVQGPQLRLRDLLNTSFRQDSAAADLGGLF
jgi:hypothetical protein